MPTIDALYRFLQDTASTVAVSTALVALMAWLARSLIAERLKASVKHEFDEKLEAVKADGREREARLQAELRGRDQQLQLLQSGVLSAHASRQAALDARRLDAVDALWSAFHGLAPLRTAARFMETIKYDSALTHAATDPNIRAFFSDLAKMAGVTTEQLQARAADSPWKARLYVNEQTWKLFNAYQGVLHVLLLRLKQLENGLGKDFTKVAESIAEVKALLPHYTKFLDDGGADVLPFLVDSLGAAFERELLSMLNNEPRGAQDVEATGALMVAAEKFISSSQKTASVGSPVHGAEANRPR